MPIFKYFGNFTKTLAFIWCEKQLNASSVWYMMTDYEKTGVNKKFVDGVGLTYDTLASSLIIESSGYDQTENVKHVLGDTLKNLKNATDCLKHLKEKVLQAVIKAEEDNFYNNLTSSHEPAGRCPSPNIYLTPSKPKKSQIRYLHTHCP